MDVCFCRVLYTLPSNGLITQNKSPRDGVYGDVAYQWAYTSQYQAPTYYSTYGSSALQRRYQARVSYIIKKWQKFVDHQVSVVTVVR